MSNTIEKNIRLKAALIYIVVAGICGGVTFFVFQFRKNIDQQREQLEQYTNELILAEGFIREVNQTQAEINQYAATRVTRYYTRYQRNLEEVDSLIYSLKLIITDSVQYKKLDTIRTLLRAKGTVVARLNQQFMQANPIDTISEVLSTYVPPQKTQSYAITTLKQDTVTKTPQKKGFWKRFSELISPKEPDSVQTVTTVKTEMVKIPTTDSLEIVPEIKGYAAQASSNYTEQIRAIEKHVRELLASEQKISFQITNLVIDFYSQTVFSRLREIHESEEWIRKNNLYSIISGIIALILIFIFILLIINDVNQGYRARKTLEEANQRIKQIMESRHQLLLAVSHDIKTPLNSILGYLELKEKGSSLSQEEIRSMQYSGQHILSLLNNLLDFSSIEQGTLRLTQTVFSPREICAEIARMFEPIARRKQLHFTYHFDMKELLAVSSDSLKIKQILSNILSNAFKYTTEGGVMFNASYKENSLDFHIIDTGAGIPKEEQERIFEAFARVESNNSLAEGSGFGLFVVKGLVDLLKGEIHLVSDKGRGTRIEIRIPVKEEKSEAITKEAGKYILVVDDDYPFLTMIKNMLTQLGHHPITCSNLSEFGKEISRPLAYDYVLTDMEMGSFNGIDVLKAVQNTSSPIPVLVMTARANIDPEAIRAEGFAAYLPKPITMQVLSQQFGGQVPKENSFGLLDEMLDDDAESLRDVLELFISSSATQIAYLQQAVAANDFANAQTICHKMLSMFMQIGASDVTVFLKRMDSLRGKKADVYPQWKEDMAEAVRLAEAWREKIRLQLSAR
ncbi:ATP-binding protein [Parabacteroides sp. Marseille-P3160]|uniref:ATP-binding response regulator n=1 Tax=Parabacteroides sp. Marseille-P3160 TaxID=1917887 RepID=UPI0009B977D2|nr:ATP-binding protein [Parabacteroides sp. Marseille-P3160]